MRFINPWKDVQGFCNLGTYQMGYLDGREPDYYELYGWLQLDERGVQRSLTLGARYGNEGHEYLSGECWYDKTTGTWNIRPASAPILLAAARYFADFYPG